MPRGWTCRTKNFIFGLLFLKRLSDRFDEECEALVAGGHDPEDADEHDFFVPKRARWSALQKVATNIGDVLNTACAALEHENASLEGVLQGIDYGDERKLGDPISPAAFLSEWVHEQNAAFEKILASQVGADGGVVTHHLPALRAFLRDSRARL